MFTVTLDAWARYLMPWTVVFSIYGKNKSILCMIPVGIKLDLSPISNLPHALAWQEEWKSITHRINFMTHHVSYDNEIYFFSRGRFFYDFRVWPGIRRGDSFVSQPGTQRCCTRTIQCIKNDLTESKEREGILGTYMYISVWIIPWLGGASEPERRRGNYCT